MKRDITHRLITWVSQSFFDNRVYTVRNGLNKGLKRCGGLGWLPIERSNPEVEFWRAIDFTGKVVYDVGAFHGLLTMYFARTARAVVAWEPTTVNRTRLEKNIALNHFSNVTIRPYALGANRQRAVIRFDARSSGTASTKEGLGHGGHTETVDIRPLDEEVDLPPPDFIKVDTEGAELEVLKGASSLLVRKPSLFLEMHGCDDADKISRVNAIVRHLVDIGYTDLVHVETQVRIYVDNAEKAAQGHIFANG
jgi:FkbM family methyltransferase